MYFIRSLLCFLWFQIPTWQFKAQGGKRIRDCVNDFTSFAADVCYGWLDLEWHEGGVIPSLSTGVARLRKRKSAS